MLRARRFSVYEQTEEGTSTLTASSTQNQLTSHIDPFNLEESMHHTKTWHFHYHTRFRLLSRHRLVPMTHDSLRLRFGPESVWETDTRSAVGSHQLSDGEPTLQIRCRDGYERPLYSSVTPRPIDTTWWHNRDASVTQRRLFVCLFIGALGRADSEGHFAPTTLYS